MFRNPFELRDDLKPETKITPDQFGRLGVDDDEPDTEIADIKTPTTLKSSVGDAGQNRRRDVAKTEQLLGDAETLDLKKTDGPTGYWGTRTSDATKTFQKQNNLKVDGQINPGGETIRALGKLAGQAIKALAPPKQSASRHSGEGRNPFTNKMPSSPQMTDDAVSENQSAARYLASQKGIGDFSTFVADGIEVDGNKAIHETADLYHQTAEMNQGQADVLIKKVMPSLSSENATRLQSAIMPGEHAETDKVLKRGDHRAEIDHPVEHRTGFPSINEIYKRGGLPDLIQEYGPEMRDQIKDWW